MSEPHTFLNATIADPWGGTETVYAGSLPTWAAKEPEAFGPWKQARRKAFLADRTSEPRGWRVTFAITEQDEGDEPDTTPQNAPDLQASTTG